ncbi:MAG: acylphosphatase [Parcubacteria group bacterium]|nr:acylphosphatase [Parcubacteria group bacterium]
MIRMRIWVSGRVQGVWYRRSAEAKAKKLGITGWARNLIDGRVEMVCEGTEENMRAFLEWAGKGPFFARVSVMETREEAYQGTFASFEVREFGF